MSGVKFREFPPTHLETGIAIMSTAVHGYFRQLNAVRSADSHQQLGFLVLLIDRKEWRSWIVRFVRNGMD